MRWIVFVAASVALTAAPAWAQQGDLTIQRVPPARIAPGLVLPVDTGPLWADAGRAQRAYVDALMRATEAEIAAQRRRGAVDADLAELKRQLDELSMADELDEMRLQLAMDRMSKVMSTMSNILKKQSDTSSTITQNLK
jgi:hypothetical protein